MDKLLYFPHMSVPDNAWTLQNLFYWDEMQCIVPHTFLYRPDELHPFTQELLQQELLKMIHPEEYVYRVRGFEDAFIAYIESILPQHHERMENRRYINVHENKMTVDASQRIESTKFTKVHMGKMSSIGDALIEYQLAFRNGEWYCVEEKTASEFMTYLALVISEKTEATPATDSYTGLSGLNPTNIQTKKFLREELRAKILTEILPVPNHVNDLYSILRFKERYHNELRSFRKYIEHFLLELETSPKYQQNDRIEIFKEQSEDQRRYIAEKMRITFPNVFFGSICGILSSAIPVGISIANQDPWLAIVGGGLGVLSAVYSLRKNNNIQNNPLTYAALLDRKFGKPRLQY